MLSRSTKHTQQAPMPCVVTLDDDPLVARLIEGVIKIPMLCYSTPKELLEHTDQEPVAVFVDIHLRDENGLSVVPTLRKRWPYSVLIVITADQSSQTIRQALALGADDFILKPLRPQEIVARLQTRLNDQAIKRNQRTVTCGDFQLDQAHRLLKGPKAERFLSPTETNLVLALVRASGMTVERDVLKKQCWDQIAVSENALDRKIFDVRRALKDIGSCYTVGTAYGVGFYLEYDGPNS